MFTRSMLLRSAIIAGLAFSGLAQDDLRPENPAPAGTRDEDGPAGSFVEDKPDGSDKDGEDPLGEVTLEPTVLGERFTVPLPTLPPTTGPTAAPTATPARSLPLEDRPTDVCKLSKATPIKPLARLTICKWYSERSCCVPQQGEEIEEMFDFLMEIGSECQSTNKLYDQMRLYFCMGCSPRQPKFTRKMEMIESLVAEHLSPNLGMLVNATRYEVYVCEDFGDTFYPPGKTGRRGEVYDRCGVKLSPETCNMDMYMCGASLYFPGADFGYDINRFTTALKPPLLRDPIQAGDNFQITVWPRDNNRANGGKKEGDKYTWDELEAAGWECFSEASSARAAWLDWAAATVLVLWASN